MGLNSIINSGVDDRFDNLTGLRIKFLNIDCVAGIIMPILAIIYYASIGFDVYWVYFASLGYSAIFAFTFYLNGIHKHAWASILGCLFPWFILVLNSLILGSEFLFHIIFLALSLTSYIYFLSDRWKAHLIACLCIASFLFFAVYKEEGFIPIRSSMKDDIALYAYLLCTVVFLYKLLFLSYLYFISLESLQEREATYRNLFETSVVGILEVDVKDVLRTLRRLKSKGISDIRAHIESHPRLITQLLQSIQILQTNQAILAMLEAEQAEEFTPAMEKLFLPQSKDALIDQIESLFQTNTFLDRELNVCTVKGNPKTLWFGAKYDPETGDTKLAFTFIDITAKKQVELDLVKRKGTLNAVVNSSNASVYAIDRSHRYILCNTQYKMVIRRLFEGEVALHKHVSECFGEKVYEFILPLYERAFSGETFSVMNKWEFDGGDEYYNVTFSPVKDNMGTIIGCSVIAVDITDIKRTQEALAESEERYRMLFDNAFDGIFVYNYSERVFEDCNNRLLELLKLNNKEAFFTSNPFLSTPEYQSNGKKSSNEILFHASEILTQGRSHFEWESHRQDGSSFTTEVHSIKQQVDDQTFIIGLVKDITARKQQEQIIQDNVAKLNKKNEELQRYIESNMQLENFAYMASHDLKAPMRTIVSYSQLLERRLKGKLGESEKEFLDFIVAATKRMHSLINDLLAYSRVNSQAFVKSRVLIPLILNRIIQDLRIPIRETGAEIEIGEMPEWINGDSTRLRQLFQNLLTNAMKFHKPNEQPRIWVSAKEEKAYWQFAVRDNGIGIAPEFHKKIFLLFRKLHSHDTYEGTGIGLALCQKVVEQHGGEIWLDSAQGEGTTFHFTIAKEFIQAPQVS